MARSTTPTVEECCPQTQTMMPMSREDWIQVTSASFYRLVYEAKIAKDGEIPKKCGSEMHNVTIYRVIGRPIDAQLRDALECIYSEHGCACLQMDCLDEDGDVWIGVWKWDPEHRRYALSGRLWTTVAAYRYAGSNIRSESAANGMAKVQTDVKMTCNEAEGGGDEGGALDREEEWIPWTPCPWSQLETDLYSTGGIGKD